MMSKNISIAPIQAEDNQAIFELIQDILESYNLDRPGTAYTDPYLNQLYEFYQKERRAEYWILKKGEEVIGGIGIGPFGYEKEIAELQKYYIKKEEQGKGYGRLLYQKVLSFAETMGYKALYIETMDVLAQANNVYEHLGFRLLKEPLSGSEHGLMNRWYLLELNDKRTVKEQTNTLKNS